MFFCNFGSFFFQKESGNGLHLIMVFKWSGESLRSICNIQIANYDFLELERWIICYLLKWSGESLRSIFNSQIANYDFLGLESWVIFYKSRAVVLNLFWSAAHFSSEIFVAHQKLGNFENYI